MVHAIRAKDELPGAFGDVNVISVAMGQLAILDDSGALVCEGVGSGICVVLFDREAQVAGLVYALLPRLAGDDACDQPLRYVESGIQSLRDGMLACGASGANMQAVLMGGADAFRFTTTEDSSPWVVGRRNIQAAKDELSRLEISVRSMDLGGCLARSLRFSVTSGDLFVRTHSGAERMLINLREE